MFRIEEHHTNIKTTKLFYSNRFNMNIYNIKSKYLNGYTSYENYPTIQYLYEEAGTT